METLEAIHSRCSVRDFTDQTVPEELLRQVLQAATSSASGGNVQPWAFVVIQDPSDDQALRDFLHRACLRYAAELKERVASDKPNGP